MNMQISYVNLIYIYKKKISFTEKYIIWRSAYTARMNVN